MKTPVVKSVRLDVFLAERGLAKSRERAKELIKAGHVFVDGRAVTKPAYEVGESSEVKIVGGQLKYVGRGGLKLEKAIAEFGIELEGRVCADIGASAGGFTDCMLQNGAAYVYAVDVGHGQLDESLAADGRVLNMEGTNIKDLSAGDFPKRPDFISADVSFVSLKKILPKIREILPEGGESAVLIKPQFEAGRAAIGKGGIVKDRKVHERVLEDIAAFCLSEGLPVVGLDYSPISGGDGNIEYLAYLKIGGVQGDFDFKKIVSSAFDELK
ncbi:MAG: TlyA family RNA methyltransferase [Ruminococcus sp.]|nr:TlyA family RNA methyltransferase [Ruminococcus sp.]MCM1382150.1 TlyA family RNA methyltransferase [Muribaculaceae bacterium]MCM1478130.1 TlyA family RNA methyltransferase [Muribaculaceae bacterium]